MGARGSLWYNSIFIWKLLSYYREMWSHFNIVTVTLKITFIFCLQSSDKLFIKVLFNDGFGHKMAITYRKQLNISVKSWFIHYVLSQICYIILTEKKINKIYFSLLEIKINKILLFFKFMKEVSEIGNIIITNQNIWMFVGEMPLKLTVL